MADRSSAADAADRPLHVLLGVTGSIAAFKAAQLASDLVQAGYEVRVTLTPGGARFVTPLTFAALTGHAVAVEVWDEQPGSSRMGHVELAHWADVVVVAPASAGAMARLALGLTTTMLDAAALATAAPLVVAPAMETQMWQHPATQAHVATLRARGAMVVGPESGRLASGREGLGRLAEPAAIVDAVRKLGAREGALRGARVLVTAGPTYEAIDPLRFMGNRSSGKMGYAVAEEARNRGAHVTLISGPSALVTPGGVEVIRVESAAQMEEAVLRHAPSSDVVVMAAAVADYRPAVAQAEKLKRGGNLSLELVPTADIAAVASAAAPQAIHVGFAVESSQLTARAREKLQRKGQHLVVANAISADFSPFGSDTNRVAFVTASGSEELPELSKPEIAQRLWDEIGRLLGGRGWGSADR